MLLPESMVKARCGESRFFLGSSGNVSIARQMFGIEESAWSKTVLNLNLDYMDRSFLQDRYGCPGGCGSGEVQGGAAFRCHVVAECLAPSMPASS